MTSSGKATATQTHTGEAPLVFNNFRQRLLLACVCFFLYGNTVLNEYSFDDNIVVSENPYVLKGFSGIPDLLTNPYRKIGDLEVEYRPLSGITLAVEQQFFGGNPHVSHGVNVLFFTLLVLLVHFVLRETYELKNLHWALPFFVALFYAAHPSNTETVASIKNREQILSMLFALAALYYADRYFFKQQQKTYYAALSVFMLALSLMSKMVLSIPVLAVLMLTWFFKSDRKLKTQTFVLFALLLTVTGGFALANAMISTRPVTFIENPLAAGHDVLQRTGFMLKTLFFYFKFMLIPFPFRFYYGFDTISLASFNAPLVLFSFLIHLVIFVTGIAFMMRKRISGLFMLCYLANISFYSNLYPVPGIVSERTLFIAGLWFTAAVVVLIFESGVFRNSKPGFPGKLIIAAGILLFLTHSGMTVHRNFQWKNQGTLMSSDIGHLEKSALANYIYAKYLFLESEKTQPDEKRNLLERSKKHFRQATLVYPEHFDSYFRLGMIYEYHLPNRDSALFYFRTAYEVNPADNPVRFQLGKQYFLSGNYDEANRLFDEVYREIPHDTLTLFFYTLSLLNSGAAEEALTVNAKLEQLAPDASYAYYNYGMIYRHLGDMAKAAENFEKCMYFGYSDNEIKNILLNYYLSNGMQERAMQLDFR